MEIKKIHVRAIALMAKSRTLIAFLFLFLFIPTCFGATVEDLNTSLENRWLGKESMRNILNELNIEVTEEELVGYTYQFNEWFKTVENESVTIKNIVFYQYRTTNKNLYWLIGNGSFSENLEYIYCRMKEFGQSWSESGVKFDGYGRLDKK